MSASRLPHLTLKPGRDKAIRNRHHWIFSGAIQQYPNGNDGDFVAVHSSTNEFLGSAYINRQSNIVARMVAFDATPPLEAIKRSLDNAVAFRRTLFDDAVTNAYRLVNGEGDFLPGLIVDRYASTLVLQTSTLGMDKQRAWLVDYFTKTLKPATIYEKSNLASRKEEKLQPQQGHLFGKQQEEVDVLENGLKFAISIATGQKTGMFLDHRDMRQWVRTLSHNKTVLNCFSYTGAFTIYALAGGATHVDSVEISEDALSAAKRNVELNGLSLNACGFHSVDVFDFLRENALAYDLVILDPPAFAKRQKDVVAACRGYKDINRLAMQKMPKNSLLLTSSCSYYVDESLFQKVLFQAAVEAKRAVRIIGKHRLAPDHPINICHPEGNYLKSFLLYIE